MRTAVAFAVAALAWPSNSHAVEASPLEQIEAMPFVKAYAYVAAINELCFPGTPLIAPSELRSSAYAQAGAIGVPGLIRDAAAKAVKHLAGDQSACVPAAAFIERTISALPETQPQLKALITEVKAQEAKRLAAEKDETERREAQERQQREAEQAQIKAIQLKLCNQTLAKIENGVSEETSKEERRDLFRSWANQIRACFGHLPRETVLKAEEIAKAEVASVEKQFDDEWARKNPPAICNFKGLPKMAIAKDRASKWWLTIGNDPPVELTIAAGFTMANMSGGEEITIHTLGAELGGKLHKGKCEPGIEQIAPR